MAQGNPNTATLSGMCLFRSAPTQSLKRLTPLLHERSLPAGASVLAAEQPGEAVYVLLRAPSRSTSSRPAGGGDLGHQIEVPVTAQNSWLAGVQSFRKPLSERVLDVMYTDLGPVGEDADHVEPQGFEVWPSGVEVVFGYGAQGILLAGGDGFQWVSEAGPAPQLDFHEDEGVVFAHYQVDLPAPGPVVTLEECVTVLDQVAQGEVFTPCPWGFVFQSLTPA